MESFDEPGRVMDQLYIGDKKFAADKDRLQELGITHIVNVTADIRHYFQDEPLFQYFRCPCNDTEQSDLSIYFEDAIAFINAARAEGHGVLIHCQQGISRSSTIMCAFLISTGLSLAQAYTHLKKCWPQAKPKSNFLRQLVEFEKRRKEKIESSEKKKIVSELAIVQPSERIVAHAVEQASHTNKRDDKEEEDAIQHAKERNGPLAVTDEHDAIQMRKQKREQANSEQDNQQQTLQQQADSGQQQQTNDPIQMSPDPMSLPSPSPSPSSSSSSSSLLSESGLKASIAMNSESSNAIDVVSPTHKRKIDDASIDSAIEDIDIPAKRTKPVEMSPVPMEKI